MYMLHLPSTNQFTATNFTPVKGRPPGEASSVGCLPRSELKWMTTIGRGWLHVSTIAVLSTQEDAARGDRKEPSSGNQQAGGQAETSASGNVLGSVPTGYGNTSDIKKMTKEVMYVHLIFRRASFHSTSSC